MDFMVVIPARWRSSRFPGKALVPICGKPMIVQTYVQCTKAVPMEKIVVATDDTRISSVCREHDIPCVMTSVECLTGTDRVAEVANMIEADSYINVQGDEPTFNPDDLTDLITAIDRFPGEVVNGYCRIHTDDLYFSRMTPKVVVRPDGRLLYMSRAPIPMGKVGQPDVSFRQVCAYVFPRESLRLFALTKVKMPLEAVEDIEVLRLLELGFEIRMIELSDQSVSVDEEKDVAIAESKRRELGLD